MMLCLAQKSGMRSCLNFDSRHSCNNSQFSSVTTPVYTTLQHIEVQTLHLFMSILRNIWELCPVNALKPQEAEVDNIQRVTIDRCFQIRFKCLKWFPLCFRSLNSSKWCKALIRFYYLYSNI